MMTTSLALLAFYLFVVHLALEERERWAPRGVVS